MRDLASTHSGATRLHIAIYFKPRKVARPVMAGGGGGGSRGGRSGGGGRGGGGGGNIGGESTGPTMGTVLLRIGMVHEPVKKGGPPVTRCKGTNFIQVPIEITADTIDSAAAIAAIEADPRCASLQVNPLPPAAWLPRYWRQILTALPCAADGYTPPVHVDLGEEAGC